MATLSENLLCVMMVEQACAHAFENGLSSGDLKMLPNDNPYCRILESEEWIKWNEGFEASEIFGKRKRKSRIIAVIC